MTEAIASSGSSIPDTLTGSAVSQALSSSGYLIVGQPMTAMLQIELGLMGERAVTHRLSHLAAVLLLVTLATVVEAQPKAPAVPRIGVLMWTEISDAYREALRQGLRDRGYVEGQNIVIEWRHAGGRKERAVALATELVGLKVDLIVATLTPAVRAAKDATATIPIVMAPAGDPVGQGFGASLARPGGNVTGMTGLTAELSGKRLQLLRYLMPNLNRVAVLLAGNDPFWKPFLQENETAAKNAGVQLHIEVVRRPEEIDTALGAIAQHRLAIVIIQPGLVTPSTRASEVAALALRHRLAAVSQAPEFAESGGLLSYGVSFTDMVRGATLHIDRILKGASPRDLPVEQATTFQLVVNLRTAKALGIAVPQLVRLQADRVIE